MRRGGSTFTILWPLADANAEAARAVRLIFEPVT